MTATPTPVSIRPDREFRDRLISSGGEDLKKCFQCATCSVVCQLSDTGRPFPRKEMMWAQWGLKERLVADVDIWLCHQCGDCTARCPRGARPGDVMAAIRREAIFHYSAPSRMGQWANRPGSVPLLLLFSFALMGLLAWAGGPLQELLGACYHRDRIIISYWSQLPQRLLIVLFTPFAFLDAVAMALGAMRLWRDLRERDREAGRAPLARSVRSALGSIILHEHFDQCTAERIRMYSHMLVFFGFVGLLAVDVWVIGARFNPLLRNAFAYPFNFWSPWKILANLAGCAVLIGCSLMVRDRMAGAGRSSTWFDWTLIGLIMAAVTTGFACEILHYARIDPLRYAAYVVHLATVFTLLVLLPYSKFAHMVYRGTALVYAARRSS
jgi:quinone-modifying oxidoreductase subunit QmoC